MFRRQRNQKRQAQVAVPGRSTGAKGNVAISALIKGGAKASKIASRIGGRGGRPDSGMVSLLDSIQTHRKFKQLATYSIECVTKVVDSLHSNWIWNVKECLDQGIMPAVADVLKIHTHDDHVLVTAMRFSSFVVPYADDAALNEKLITGGGFDAALLSTHENKELDDNIVAQVMWVAADITEPVDPSVPYTDRAVDSVIGTMKRYTKHDETVTACLQVLTNMARNPVVAARIVAGDGLATILAAMQGGSESVVAMAFQLLDRLAGGGLGDDIKKAGSLKMIVRALLSHLDNEPLLQQGAALIKTLTSPKLPESKDVLRANDVSEAEALFVLSILPAHHDELVSKMGIAGAVVELLRAPPAEDDVLQTLQLACLAQSRVASSAARVQALIDADGLAAVAGVFALCEAKAQDAESEEAAANASAAAVRALVKLCDTRAHAEQMAATGALKGAINTLAAHPAWHQLALQTMFFVQQLRSKSIRYDARELLSLGTIEAVLRAMGACKDRRPLQLAGVHTLLLFLRAAAGEDGVGIGGAGSPKARMLAASPGVVPHSLELMRLHMEDRPLMYSTMRLLVRIFTSAADRAHLDVGADTFDNFANLCFCYRADVEMRALASSLVGAAVADEDARKPFGPLRSATSAAAGPEQLAATAEPLLKRIGTFGLDTAVALSMCGAEVNGVETVLLVIKSISSPSAKFDGQLHALRVALWAMHELLSAKPELSEELLKQLVETLLHVANAFPELAEEAARSLQVLAQFPRAHKLLVDTGAIELCVALLKAHPTNERIGEMCGACLDALARSPTDNARNFAMLIARKGGTQEALAFCKRNAGARALISEAEKAGDDSSGISRSLYDSGLCALGEMLCAEVAHEDLVDVLKRQGAVESLISTMFEYKRGDKVSRVCARALAPLLKPADLTRDLPNMEELAGKVSSSQHEIPANSTPRLMRLGRMARAGPPFKAAADIVANGGADTVTKLCEQAAKRTQSAERDELIAACLDALGDIAAFAGVDGLERLVPVVLEHLAAQGLDADMRVFDFLDTLACDGKAAARLVAEGGVKQLFELFKEAAAAGDDARVAALARALAGLARRPEAVAELVALGAVEELIKWLAEHGSTAEEDAVAQVLDLLAKLVPTAPPADLDNFLGLVKSDVFGRTIEEHEPAALTAVQGALRALCGGSDAGDGHTDGASGALEKRVAARTVQAFRSKLPIYGADGDCVTALVGMTDALFLNGGESAGDALEEQGVPQLLREILGMKLVPDDVLSAVGLMLSKLNAGGEGMALFEAVEALNAVLDADVLVVEDVSAALQAVQTEIMTAQVTAATAAAALEALLKAVRKIGDRAAIDGISDSEYNAWQDSMAIALATLGRLASEPTLVLDELLAAISKVMSQDEKAEVSLTSAIKALVQIAGARGVEALQAIVSAGVLDRLAGLAANAASASLRATARDALAALAAMLTPEMIAGLDSATLLPLLSSLVKALLAAGEHEALQKLLASILAQEGGLQRLCELMRANPGDAALLAAVMRAIDACGVSVLYPEFVKCLLIAIVRSQRSAQNGESSTEDEVALSEATAPLMLKLFDGGNDEGCKMFTSLSVPDDIDSADKEYAGAPGCKTLLGAFLHGNTNAVTYALPPFGEYVMCKAAEVTTSFTEHKLGPVIVARMEDFDDLPAESREAWVHAALVILRRLLENIGVDALGLGDHEKDVLLSLIKRLAYNPKILSEGKSLLDALGVPTIELDSDLSFVARILEAADPLKLFDEAGLERWRSDRSGSVYDSMPKEYSDMIQVLNAICGMLDGQVGVVSGEALERIVHAILAHMNDREVVTLGIKALSKLASNKTNMLHLAKFNLTADMLRDALQVHADDASDEGAVRYAMDLTTRLARNGAFRKRFGPMGIDALIKAIVRFSDRRLLVIKCLAALCALSRGMPLNVHEMKKCALFDALPTVLDMWGSDFSVIIELCYLISMLLSVVEDYGADACDSVGRKLIEAVARNCLQKPDGAASEPVAELKEDGEAGGEGDASQDAPDELELMKMIARALGSISCDTESAPVLLESKIVETFVDALNAPIKADGMARLTDADAAKTVIDVIGNLALANDDDAVEGLLDPIISEGGVELIANAFREHSFEVSVLACGLDALCNMEGEMDAYDAMIDEGLVDACIDIVKCFDYEIDLTDTAVQLLSLLTESDCCVPHVCKREVIQTLLRVMAERGLASHNDDDAEDVKGEEEQRAATKVASEEQTANFLKFVATIVKNVCAFGDARVMVQGIIGGTPRAIASWVEIIDANMRRADFVERSMLVMTLLAIDDDLSLDVASSCAHSLMEAIRVHFDKPTFLVAALTLLAQLALSKDNLPTLVQHGAVKIVTRAISTYPESVDVIRKCVTAIDHIAIASNEYAVIVTEYGGFDAVRTIAEAYCDNDEILALCTHATNSIVTMTMHVREKEAARRDKEALTGMLGNMAPEKVTGRILKLRLKMQGAEESDIREGHPKTRKGWLDKNDSSGKKWKKRYFVLSARHIRYFTNEEESILHAEAPKGEIPLSNGTQLKAQTNGHKMAFQLVCPQYDGQHTKKKAVFDRTFTLCARSHEDGKDWQACIRHNIELVIEEDGEEEDDEEDVDGDVPAKEFGSAVVGIGDAVDPPPAVPVLSEEQLAALAAMPPPPVSATPPSALPPPPPPPEYEEDAPPPPPVELDSGAFGGDTVHRRNPTRGSLPRTLSFSQGKRRSTASARPRTQSYWDRNANGTSKAARRASRRASLTSGVDGAMRNKRFSLVGGVVQEAPISAAEKKRREKVAEAEAEVAEALGMMDGRITEAGDERGSSRDLKAVASSDTSVGPDSMMMAAEPMLAMSELASADADHVSVESSGKEMGSGDHARTTSVTVLQSLVDADSKPRAASGAGDGGDKSKTGSKVQKKAKRSSVNEDGTWESEEKAVKHSRQRSKGGGVWNKMKGFASRHSSRASSRAHEERTASTASRADSLSFARKGSAAEVLARTSSGASTPGKKRWFGKKGGGFGGVTRQAPSLSQSRSDDL